MLQAMALSARMGWIKPDDVTRATTLIQQANLPTKAPVIPSDIALDLMSHDKKVKSSHIRLILLKALGNAIITADYDANLLTQVLDDTAA